MAVALRSVLVLVRNLPASLDFWGQRGLGLVPRHTPTDTYAELTDVKKSFTLALKQVDGNEAMFSQGYSPMLNFDVADLDSTVSTCVQLGATLDGPIKRPELVGKIAALRSPDGVMIGLTEENKQPM